jgi:hypothetical protein
MTREKGGEQGIEARAERKRKAPPPYKKWDREKEL